jgi:hypothetical protein
MDRTHHDDNFEAPERGVPAGMEMDNRMMWAMVACCLAIPAALILGAIAGGGLIGAGGWLLLAAGALAVALVIARKRVVGSHRRSRSDVGD